MGFNIFQVWSFFETVLRLLNPPDTSDSPVKQLPHIVSYRIVSYRNVAYCDVSHPNISYI